GIQHPSQQCVAGANGGLAAAGVDLGGGGDPVQCTQRRQQRVLPGDADHLGRQAEAGRTLSRRVAQFAQLADGGLQPGRADQRAVRLGDLADALDGTRLVERTLDQGIGGGQRRHSPASPSASSWARASAVRIASICWAIPARTCPASETTTQLSGSRLSSSTTSITPTAGCAWRTAPRPALTDSRTDGCTRISRNCSACAASTASRTSAGATALASNPGASRATMAQA